MAQSVFSGQEKGRLVDWSLLPSQQAVEEEDFPKEKIQVLFLEKRKLRHGDTVFHLFYFLFSFLYFL